MATTTENKPLKDPYMDTSYRIVRLLSKHPREEQFDIWEIVTRVVKRKQQSNSMDTDEAELAEKQKT